MTTKTQIQNKIQELEAELQDFKNQLDSYKDAPTFQEAEVGDTLEDGSIVLKKENGLVLLVAPKSTEVKATWSQEFTDVFEKLGEQGFNPSQWFIPTKEQLKLAYETIPNEFSSTIYWSSTDINNSNSWAAFFTIGRANSSIKENQYRVRAFRCVTY